MSDDLRMNNEEISPIFEEIKELNPDVICVVAYRKNSTKRNLRKVRIYYRIEI